MNLNDQVETSICKNSNMSFSAVSVSFFPEEAELKDLEGFIDRQYGPFEYTIKDKNNDIAAIIKFYFSYTGKGSYQGHGAYLVNATVSPKFIFVAPGYYLDCNVTSSNFANYGTKTDPIPGVTLKLQCTVKGCSPFLYVEGNNFLEDEGNSPTSNNSDISNKKIVTPIKNNENKIQLCPKRDEVFSEISFFTIVTLRGDCRANIVVAENY